jgi:hypothetical protein
LTKVQEKLKRNTNLASKLEGRLPEGTDLMKAAYGFKNLGQFVAAVNVSDNHGFKFTELKKLMVVEGYSLGQAMQKLKADANTTVVAQRAEADAQTLITTTEREMTAPAGVSATTNATSTASTTVASTTTSGTATTTTTTKKKAKAKARKPVAGQQ